MRVRIKINLGSRDAERFGLDFSKCLKGSELEVADEAGERLISHGIAEQLKPVVGVAPKPAIAEAQAPVIQTATNPGKSGSKHKEN